MKNNRARYLVSFYKDGVLKHQFGALGFDRMDAKANAEKYLQDEGYSAKDFIGAVETLYPHVVNLRDEERVVYRMSINENGELT